MRNEDSIAAARHWSVSSAIVFGLVLSMSIVAYKAYPIWDDWGIDYAVGAGGQISEFIGDRPVRAIIGQLCQDSGYLLETSFLVHLISWTMMGWVTYALWLQWFPTHANLSWLAAGLAIAPILCKTQYILIASQVGCTFGPALAYGGLLLAFRSVPRNSILRRIAMVCVAAIATLLSEYGAVATVVGAILLFIFAPYGSKVGVAARRVDACVFVAAAILGYVIYATIADADQRPEVHPTNFGAMASEPYRWKAFLPRWLTMVWQATLGEFFCNLGSLEIVRRPSAWGAVFGTVIAVIFWWLLRKERSQAVEAEQGLEAPLSITLSTLLGCIGLAMIPVVLMSRRYYLEEPFSSRYWLTVLPLCVCFLLRFLILLCGQARVSWIVGVCGFMIGYSVLNTGLHYWRQRNEVTAWAESLKERFPADGFVLVYMDFNWTRDRSRKPTMDEVFARLTFNWSKQDRERIWVTDSIQDILPLKLGEPPQITVRSRWFKGSRTETIDQVWVVRPNPSDPNDLEIESIQCGGRKVAP